MLSVLKDPELSPYWTPALGDERHWRVQDLIGSDLRPVSPIIGTLSPGQKAMMKEFHTFNMPISGMRTIDNHAKTSNNTAKRALYKKCSSNVEVSGIPSESSYQSSYLGEYLKNLCSVSYEVVQKST